MKIEKERRNERINGGRWGKRKNEDREARVKGE